MKKFNLLLALSIAICSTTYAQVTVSTKLGLTFANNLLTGSDAALNGSSTRLSGYGGVALDFPLNNEFSFQTGLLLVGKGVKQDRYESVTEDNVTYTLDVKGKIAPLYLELPMNFLHDFKLGKVKLTAGFGPYYAIGMGGKFDLSYNQTINAANSTSSNGATINGRIKYGNDSDSNLKRHDIGVNASLYYLFNANLGIQGGYSIGLTTINIKSEGTDSALDVQSRNSVFSVGFIYKY